MKTIASVTEIKTIDINTLTWLDKIDGNTYFAQRITLNYGLDNETEIINPFKYGYSSFDSFAFDALRKYFNIDGIDSFFDLIEEDDLIIRSNIKESFKRELLALSK